MQTWHMARSFYAADQYFHIPQLGSSGTQNMNVPSIDIYLSSYQWRMLLVLTHTILFHSPDSTDIPKSYVSPHLELLCMTTKFHVSVLSVKEWHLLQLFGPI